MQFSIAPEGMPALGLGHYSTVAFIAPMPYPQYSIFGIAVDRRHALKWLFHQEKDTFHGSQEVYVYSENAPETDKQNPAVFVRNALR
jgi:hypothetical protein